MPHVTLTHDDVVDDFATLCAGVTPRRRRPHRRGRLPRHARQRPRERPRSARGAMLGMGAVLARRTCPAGETVGRRARRHRCGPGWLVAEMRFHRPRPRRCNDALRPAGVGRGALLPLRALPARRGGQRPRPGGRRRGRAHRRRRLARRQRCRRPCTGAAATRACACWCTRRTPDTSDLQRRTRRGRRRLRRAAVGRRPARRATRSTRAVSLMEHHPSVGLVYGFPRASPTSRPRQSDRVRNWTVWPGHEWLRAPEPARWQRDHEPRGRDAPGGVDQSRPL